MDLRDYLSILWRRKWVIVLTVAVTLAVVAIGHAMSTPRYTASTTLRVATSAVGIQYPSSYSYQEQLMNTYVEIAASRPVRGKLAERLSTNPPPEISAEVIPNTELIRLTAVSTDAALSARAANELAAILIEESDQLYAGGAKPSTEILTSQVDQSLLELETARNEYERTIVQTPAAPDEIVLSSQLVQEKQRTYETLLRQYEQAQYREAMQASMITVMEPAIAPRTPSAPRVALNYSLGAILSLLAGVMLAFLFENMDSRLHATRTIETAAHARTLARFPKTTRNHLFLSENGSSPLAESVRHLAVQIQWMGYESPRKVLLLAGAEPEQGASTAAVNLAAALAEQGRNVVIVDCNLRHPEIHTLFGLDNAQGMTNVLSNQLDLKQALQPIADKHVTVLPTGPVTAAPSHALEASKVESLLGALRQQFDYVLLDAPALTVADGASFVPFADGLILVVRRSHARRGTVESAGEFLSRFNGKFLGLVVNEAEDRTVHSYG